MNDEVQAIERGYRRGFHHAVTFMIDAVQLELSREQLEALIKYEDSIFEWREGSVEDIIAPPNPPNYLKSTNVNKTLT